MKVNGIELKVKANSLYDGITVEVGPWDPDRFDGQGGFEFGMTAEARVGTKFGSDVYEYEVQFGAIGSHDADKARRRLASYQAAIDIAEMLPRYVDKQVDFKTIATSLENDTMLGLMLDENTRFVADGRGGWVGSDSHGPANPNE